MKHRAKSAPSIPTVVNLSIILLIILIFTGNLYNFVGCRARLRALRSNFVNYE